MSIRRYKNDWIVAIGIIVVLVIIYGIMIGGQRKRFAEESLTNELRTLRMAVIAYHYINGRNPADFEELANGSFKTAHGNERPYLPPIIKKRGFKDPFGSPYLYDAESGWVKSTSSKYDEW